MNNNLIKIFCVTAIICGMIALAIAKVIWPTIEITLINATLLQLLAALGVYHATQQPTKDTPNV